MSRVPDPAEEDAVVAAGPRVLAQMEHLSTDARIALLCALVAQEICTLPSSERMEELQDVLADLPEMFHETEQAMRGALARNAEGEGDG